VRDTLRKLVSLARVDDELKRVEAELAQLPGRAEAAEEERRSADARAQEAREAVEAQELEQRSLEGRLADSEERARHLEGQTAQVKSNEAYTTLLREIDDAKATASGLEDQILEAMEAVGEARERLAEAERDAAAVGARVDEERRRLAGLGDDLAKESERLRAARDAAAAELESADLARYEKVAAKRRPAVAVVSRELCSGCRVGIPPQDYVDLISAARVISCGSCKRILVHETMLGEAQTPPAPGEGAS
jgi:predicted  nucleic acid-binding Zn-ribbon protein